MAIENIPAAVDAAGGYQLNFPIESNVMDILQQNVQKLKDIKVQGQIPPELQDMLERVSGDVNKFDIAFVSNDNRSLILNIGSDAPSLPAPVGAAGLPDGIGGRANPFLTATFIMVLVEVMTEMMKLQSQQKMTEKKLDLMAQQWQFELAVRAAHEIMESAKKEALMHYLLAASAAVQIGVAAAQGAVGGAMMMRSIKMQNKAQASAKADMETAQVKANALRDQGPPVGKSLKQTQKNEARHAKQQRKADEEALAAENNYKSIKAGRWGGITQTYNMLMFPMTTAKDITENTAKMYENLVQGILKVEKARHEAALKIIEGYQDIARRISNNASDAWKELQENINAEADFMTKIIDKNYQAFSYRIH